MIVFQDYLQKCFHTADLLKLVAGAYNKKLNCPTITHTIYSLPNIIWFVRSL